MSLINDVLRKLDEEGPSRGPDPVPANLQATDRQGRSAWALWAGVGVIAALGAGAGVVWAPWTGPEPPGPESSAQPAQTAKAPGAEADKTAPEKGDETSPESGKAPGSDESGPHSSAEAASKDQAQTAPAEAPVARRPEERPRRKNESADPEPGKPVREGRDAREEAPSPEKKAAPPVKQGPTDPLKVVVNPPREEPSAAQSSAPGREATGRETPSGPGGRGGNVKVSVPQSWESRQRARRMAREGFQALEAGRYGPAAERLARAHRLAPNRPDIVNNLGLARWRAGRHQQAIATLIDGVRAHPGNARLARNLGNLLGQTGGPDVREEGVRALGKALQQQDRLGLYAVLGALLRDMDRPGEAVSVYRRGTSRQGPHWRLLVGLGGALEEAGRSREALTVYRKARKRLSAGQDGLAERLAGRIRSLQDGLD